MVRRIFATGGFAAIERRGAAEAGSVFVVVRDRNGGVALYEPAPQSLYDSGKPQDRYFCRSDREKDSGSVERRVASEIRFDTDVWVVELEPGSEPIENLISMAPNDNPA